jgi:type IV pilus assembly protein PilO
MDLQSLPWYGQFLVFLFIGGVVFGMFYMLHYSENQNTIASLEKQIEDVEMEIKRAEKKEGQLKQIQEEIKAKEKVLDDLKEVLPEEKEVSQILRKVQGILSGARLRIQNWNTQATRRKEVYMEHPFSISVQGNYHNLGMFFDQLSRLKKIFTVNSVRIRPLKQMTSTFSINVSFTTSTYTYKERQKAKKKRGR